MTQHDFFIAGGTLWRSAPSYIARPADAELLRLARRGEYANVLAARQMGKSSLMVRTANTLQTEGILTAILDISTLGGGISSADEWFFGFADELATQLSLTADVDAWWGAHNAHNAVQRFSNFLRDVVLGEITAPIVIFIDEIDSALGMAFTDDFFAAIRAAHNARASAPEFQRLTFVLVGVARPADLIRDPSRTPYNVGTHIPLRGFTAAELAPFAEIFEDAAPGYGERIIQWVLDWTNGQPYLTQKLCAALIEVPGGARSKEMVAAKVSALFLRDEARHESNLRSVRDRLEASLHRTRSLQIYERILRGSSVPDEERDPAKNELKLSGLVQAAGDGRLLVSNQIYRRVFDRLWVRKNLPGTPRRALAWAAAAFVVMALAWGGAAWNRQQGQVIAQPTPSPTVPAPSATQMPPDTPAPTHTPEPTATPQPTEPAAPTPTPTATRAPAPFAGWIAYALGDGEGREIFIFDPATGAQRQITSNSVVDEAPSISPDGWLVVYASNRAPGGWELYAFDLWAGTETQLTNLEGEARFPRWSPVVGDGRLVFERRGYPAADETNIWQLEVQTGALTQVTHGGADARPDWSPGAAHLLFGRALIDTSGDGAVTILDNLDVMTLDLSEGGLRNLTNTPAHDDFNFDWSPDGRWIVFASVRSDANEDGVQNLADSEDLFLIPAEGGEEARLNLYGLAAYSPSWSPDGKTIVLLAAFENGENELWWFGINAGAREVLSIGGLERLLGSGAYYHPVWGGG
jgi:hypothetical protein